MMWWHQNYFYRRRLTITAPPEPIPQTHIITAHLGEVLLENGKVRHDFEDIEVIYEKTPQEPLYQDDLDELDYEDADFETTDDTELIQMHREVTHDENGIHVTFQIQAPMEPHEILENKYRIYYGNPTLKNQLSRLSPILMSGTLFPNSDLYMTDTINPWPEGVDYDNTGVGGGYGRISYTRPGEHWKDGVSSTPLARASLLIYATAFRVVSAVGPDKAIMEVQVDNGEWQEVDLFRPEEEAEEFASVYEEFDLSPNWIHEIRVRVLGRANTSATGDEVNIKGIEYVKPVQATDDGEEVNEDSWSSYVGGG